jgi:tetratricopeptide (TPR) repeat protein
MQDSKPDSVPLIKRRATLACTLRTSLSVAVLLISCAALAEAQMRPMKDVTVGQPEARPAQPARAASSTAQRTPAPTVQAEAKQPAQPAQTAQPTQPSQPSRPAPVARKDAAAPVVAAAPAGTATRERRVSARNVNALSGSEALERDVLEDEPPVMPAAEALKDEAKSEANDEAKDEAKGVDRLSALRARIESATGVNERSRLRRTLVDYLVSLGRQGEALAELRVMMRDERFDPVGFYNIGNALARLGDTDTAIDAYRKAVAQRHGNYARALNNLGVMLLRQGRWDEAEEPLMSALKQENFRYAEASYNLGRLYAARGEAPLAIAEWARTLRLQPDHADATLALARAYAEGGQPARGLELLDQFMSRNEPTQAMTEARRRMAAEVAASPAQRTPQGQSAP